MARPRKFQSATDFAEVVNGYFAKQEAQGRPLTMHGLARALGCSRQTLINYEHQGEVSDDAAETVDRGFVDTIKEARSRVAEWTEERLFQSGAQVAGPIFSLKNNFAWRDTPPTTVNIGLALGVTLAEEARARLAPGLSTAVAQLPALPSVVVVDEDE